MTHSAPTSTPPNARPATETTGEGVEDRGPPLTDEGRAAVDFVLRTGRMPLAAPNLQTQRGPVRYTEEQIVALVDYAGASR